MSQYTTSLNLWREFCKYNKDTNQDNPERSAVLKFLSQQADKGAAYGTLNTHRSALSLISEGNIGKDPLITRFLKGCFRLKPVKAKYSKTWDVKDVLDYLKTIDQNSSFKLISFKTLMLIVLATAQRAQTMSSIKVENIHFDETGATILVDDLLKTTRPENPHLVLNLPYFTHDPGLCAASTLQVYLEKSQHKRSDEIKYLFVSLVGKPKAVTTQTISRWLKEILKLSGIDTSVFSGHSTRHASTSAAFARGVEIDQILKTVGWSKNSKVFTNFYKRPIINKNDFAKAVAGQS